MKISLLLKNNPIKRYFSFVASLFDMKRIVFFLTELQIRGGIKDNSKIIFLLNEIIFYDPSLEPSRTDGSNEGAVPPSTVDRAPDS